MSNAMPLYQSTPLPVWAWVFKRLGTVIAALALSACGGGSSSSGGGGDNGASTSGASTPSSAAYPPLPTPVSKAVPVLQSIFPSSAGVGAAPVIITVTGSNFTANAGVQWNGSALSTFFVSATQLTATVPASYLSSSGKASVTVLTLAPGGGTSAALVFSINAVVDSPPMAAIAPAAAITSLSPASATVGAGATLLTLRGRNFTADSVVQWNGAALASTFVSANQITAHIPASQLVAATLATVTVRSAMRSSNTMGFVVSAATGLALSVSGNRFVDAAGQPVQLRGANVSVLESWLIQGHDPTRPWGGQPNGNTSLLPDFSLMTAKWFMNVVRLPLNEASWLGLSCVDLGGSNGRAVGSMVRADPLGNYQSTVQAAVAAANAAGLYVILDLHWAAPGNVCPVGPNAFANADHSLDFWTSVANTFKANPAVLFEAFSAPLPVGLASSADYWTLWTGIFSPAGSFDQLYLYGPAPNYQISYTWNATSMQALVHAIRATGASNIILIAGENASGDLSGWLTAGTASVYDMQSPPQLAAVWHAYPGSYDYTAVEYLTPVNQTNFSVAGPSPAVARAFGIAAGPVFSQLRNILEAGYPVIISEFGDQNAIATKPGHVLSSAAPFAAEIVKFADNPGASNGASISYVAWSFNTNTNPMNTLLQPPPNTTATASPGFGAYVQSHYQCRAVGEKICE